MATLIAGYMTLKKLKEIVETLESRDETGFKMTISIGDESNEFGQNVALYAEQTKEQRENKTPRYYCGNGRVNWTVGKITLAEKKEKQSYAPPSNAELEKTSDNGDAPF
jgi:hypothetical protein